VVTERTQLTRQHGQQEYVITETDETIFAKNTKYTIFGPTRRQFACRFLHKADMWIASVYLRIVCNIVIETESSRLHHARTERTNKILGRHENVEALSTCSFLVFMIHLRNGVHNTHVNHTFNVAKYRKTFSGVLYMRRRFSYSIIRWSRNPTRFFNFGLFSSLTSDSVSDSFCIKTSNKWLTLARADFYDITRLLLHFPAATATGRKALVDETLHVSIDTAK
jgi:hypothetical protein